MKQPKLLHKRDFSLSNNVTAGVDGKPQLSYVAKHTVPTGHFYVFNSERPTVLKITGKQTISAVTTDASGNASLSLTKTPLYDSSKALSRQFYVVATPTAGGSSVVATVSSYDSGTNTLTVTSLTASTEYNFDVYYLIPEGIVTITITFESGGLAYSINLIEKDLLEVNTINAYNENEAIYLFNYLIADKMNFGVKVKSDHLVDLDNPLSVITIPILYGLLDEIGISSQMVYDYYIKGGYRTHPPQ